MRAGVTCLQMEILPLPTVLSRPHNLQTLWFLTLVRVLSSFAPHWGSASEGSAKLQSSWRTQLSYGQSLSCRLTFCLPMSCSNSVPYSWSPEKAWAQDYREYAWDWAINVDQRKCKFIVHLKLTNSLETFPWEWVANISLLKHRLFLLSRNCLN